MTFETWFGAGVALLLTAYLFYVLLKPEAF